MNYYEENKELFKQYMFDSKNIKVDLRQRFWKNIIYQSLKRAKFQYIGFRG